MSCSEEHLYMLEEGCILEEVAVAGLSLVLPSVVGHLQRGHFDYTGRMGVV